ncbi:hypothetical protein LVJ94_07030 [Pendulispora rubella]|uniref:Uncharacterized protein n=1 Tax=Pendulispora rubella TaxID=2741070 RepID=A0ABZ2L7R7_9BACT
MMDLPAQDLEPCQGGGAEVRMASSVEGSLAALVSSQLRTALRARGIRVCTVPPSSSVATAAVVELSEDGHERFTIVVKDALLAKRVERSIELSSIPPDGRPLALALATDELLRASWAELLLVDAQPRQSVPPEIHRSVAPSEEPKRFELGAGFAVDHYTRGHTQLGADVAGAFWVLPRLAIEARAGFRVAPSVDAPRGEIQANATVLSLGALANVARQGSWIGADIGGRLAIVHVQFTALGDGSAQGRDVSKTAFYLNAGPRGWLAIHRFVRVVAEFNIGAPLHSLEGLDGERRVTGVGGLQLSGGLGLAGAF